MTPLALSTHWNACRSRSAREMVDECLALGFNRLELGYDLRPEFVEDLATWVAAGTLIVGSIHNFCPIPIGAPRGHPELFSLCSLDRQERDNAVFYTLRTVELAARMQAPIVVAHAGCVDMAFLTPDLLKLAAAGNIYSEAYDKLKIRLMMQREKRAPRHRQALQESLEELLPRLRSLGITLAIEITPAWECFPCESELEQLLGQFNDPALGYWHDMGHGQIRQNLGFISHERWVTRLLPWLTGMHVHDVAPPATDHLMPPRGNIDFASFKTAAQHARVLVLEPLPETPAEEIRQGVDLIRQAWKTETTEPSDRK